MKVSVRQKREAVLFFCYFFLILIDTAVFYIMWSTFYTAEHLSMKIFLVTLLFLVLYTSFARLYDGFDLKTQRIQELVYSHVITSVMTAFIMYIVTWLFSGKMPNILPILACIVMWSGISVLWSYYVVHLMKKLIIPGKALAVYDNLVAYKNGMKMSQKLDWRFSVENQICISEGMDAVYAEINKGIYEYVMLLGLTSSERNDIIKHCISNNVNICVRPNIGDFLISSAQTAQVDHLPVMFIRRDRPSLFYLGIKRLMDIFCSALALVVLSPVLLITALAIKLDDRGAVLYTQDRYTTNGRVFRIYKFRSMKENADNGGTEGIVTLQNDDRITRVGRVIRMCRIDELPQLINILKGDMSIVGPRPERIETADLYEREMPEFNLRLQVKAGLTGYAQVYGKANTDPYDKLQMDLYYISKQSISTDLKIILATIKIVFMPESTEGFEEDVADVEIKELEEVKR